MAKKSEKNSMVEVSEHNTLVEKRESVVPNENNTVAVVTEGNTMAVVTENNMAEGDHEKSEKTTQKKTRGRQKVPLKRMEKESNRLVTFSKRRTGLFKKASELCTLCGTEVAIIVFSPGRKVYSFGHPSVDSIINRYLLADTCISQPNFYVGQTSEAGSDPRIEESNMRLTILNNQLEMEKKHNEILLGIRKTREEDFRWLGRIEEFSIEDLKNQQEKLIRLKDDTYQLYRDMAVETSKVKASIKTAYNLSPLKKVGGQNPVSTHFGGQPHPMVIVPPNLVEGHNNYDHSQMMIQTPIRGFGDQSLTLGFNGISMNNAGHSMPNPMVLGFQGPNFRSSFQGDSNSMGGSQFGGNPPFPPYNLQVQGVNTMSGNYQIFNPMLQGPSSSNVPVPPFNRQGVFGSNGNRLY